MKLLQDKYFLAGEDFHTFVNRIATHLYPDDIGNRMSLYIALRNMEFVLSSPTLYNAGTSVPQCSSCFVQHVEDSLVDIMESLKRQALLSKYAGGIAQNWTSVRGCNSSLRHGFGVSQGTVPFIKCAESVTIAVNQSGKRKGACCVYLEPWHMDIEDFIELRHEEGDILKRTHHIHTALWIPDLFMERVEQNGKWTLFCPHETRYVLNNSWGTDFSSKYIELENNIDIKKKRTVDASMEKDIKRNIYDRTSMVMF